MLRVLFVVVVGIFLSGCAGSLKTLTMEEQSQYSSVIDMLEPRYKGTWLSRWSTDNLDNLKIVNFHIHTMRSNPYDKSKEEETFSGDIEGYCEAHGGLLKNYSKENRKKLQLLQKKYSTQIEDGFFECGPEGKGTISKDWTKFNLQTCRKTYNTKIDNNKINEEYGFPPSFGCETKNGFLFIGVLWEKFYGKSGITQTKLIVRINEANGALIEKSNLK